MVGVQDLQITYKLHIAAKVAVVTQCIGLVWDVYVTTVEHQCAGMVTIGDASHLMHVLKAFLHMNNVMVKFLINQTEWAQPVWHIVIVPVVTVCHISILQYNLILLQVLATPSKVVGQEAGHVTTVGCSSYLHIHMVYLS